MPVDVSSRYNETAKEFDASVDRSELLTGLTLLRRALGREVAGNVLEISVGTGRNMKYFNIAKCQSMTFVDRSGQMIEEARAKFNGELGVVYQSNSIGLYPDYKNVVFYTQDAAEPIAAPIGGYDTILQTMGLCSTPHPIQLINNMSSLCSSSGRIILLEHGRSKYDFLNRLLDGLAPTHAQRHGCWWNKDIGEIVMESGLEVVEMKRYHFGTTWWIELRPQTNN